MKKITAQTFTPIYDPVEDRLRLVVNYQDLEHRVDFMITRSFITNLIPSSEEFMETYYLSTDESKLLDNQKINIDDDEKLYKTNTTNLELYRTKEELLLEVNFSFHKDTQQTIITFNSKNISARAVLNHETMKQTVDVIKSAIPYIKWGFAPNF